MQGRLAVKTQVGVPGTKPRLLRASLQTSVNNCLPELREHLCTWLPAKTIQSMSRAESKEPLRAKILHNRRTHNTDIGKNGTIAG